MLALPDQLCHAALAVDAQTVVQTGWRRQAGGMDRRRLASQRQWGEVQCGDIMSRDVVHIGPRDSVDEAWARLAYHKIKALPVVEADGMLCGIVSLHDFFIGHSAPDPRRQPVIVTEANFFGGD